MNKLAVFVEGQTEQIFVKKLIQEIAGEKNISVLEERAATSRKGVRHFIRLNLTQPDGGAKYFVLIRDCQSDSTVKSDIIDNCESLSKAAYTGIVGLRDVYPKTHPEIPELQKYLNYGLPQRFMPIAIVLSIMEIECWFLAEVNHFTRIHPGLTCKYIKDSLDVDVENDDIEKRAHPSEDLHNVYTLVGLAYHKTRNQVQRTVNCIDYTNMYLSLPKRIKSLTEFIFHIDTFLS